METFHSPYVGQRIHGDVCDGDRALGVVGVCVQWEPWEWMRLLRTVSQP